MYKILALILTTVLLSADSRADLSKLINPGKYTGSEFTPYGFSFNFEPFTEENEQYFLESYILDAVNSKYSYKSADLDFSRFNIIGKYHITGIPCVKIYTLDTPDINRMLSIIHSTYLLVNECDSSLYFFGEDLSIFAKLFSKEIKREISPDKLINIIDLYLNSTQYMIPYFILKSAKEIEIIYNQDYLRILPEESSDTLHPMYWVYSNRLKGLEIAKEIIEPPKIECVAENYLVKFYTFTLFDDKIEYWEFRFSENYIEILFGKTVFDFDAERNASR